MSANLLAVACIDAAPHQGTTMLLTHRGHYLRSKTNVIADAERKE